VSAALARLRARRGRTLLAAAGILAASAMLGTSIAVAYALATGFDRAAERADLPDVIARFHALPPGAVDRRVRALPNLAAASYRLELQHVQLASGSSSTGDGVAQVMLGGRRGYAIVSGHDVARSSSDVVIERGLARRWHLGPGDAIDVGGLGRLRVAGVAVAPDNVAYPLASTARVWLPNSGLAARFGAGVRRVDVALLWARDPSQVDEMLVQARAVSYGVQDLRFVTRAGVRVLVDQAAGIVIALLVAFSLVAVGAAGIMLAAASQAEVQRRLESIGVERALGFSRGAVVGRHALEAALVALPAGALGLGAGALAATGPTARLLEDLNELPPGWAVLGPLGASLAAVVALVAAASAWPAWRAARRPPAEILRGADVEPLGRRTRLGGGFAALGARIVAARRVRLAATILVLATSTGVILLMLALASLLTRLESDPSVLGRRYQLTVSAPAAEAARIARVPGVAGAAPRYEVAAADSFELGEAMKLIAYPGDHAAFEEPPLAAGRRARSRGEAEIGQGLAEAVGVGVGGTLAVQLPSGRELRLRVAGVDRVLASDGRVAYVRAGPLLRAEPLASEQVAVRLEPGASSGAVAKRLSAAGFPPESAGAATTQHGGFLAVLARLLRAVAVVDGAICLYALVQALALTARERRGTIAVLRAAGANRATVARLLAGAALAVTLPAAVAGVVVERAVLGPAVGDLAAGYVSLPVVAGAGQVVLVTAGMLALGAAAAGWVARRVAREPIVAGLSEA
jgi:ABC-type antimicrobial peptide transport system permease subunit